MNSAPRPERLPNRLAASLALILLASVIIGGCERESEAPAPGATPAAVVTLAPASPGDQAKPAIASAESADHSPAPDQPAIEPPPAETATAPEATRSEFAQFVTEYSRQASAAAEAARGLEREFLAPEILNAEEAAAVVAAALERQDDQEVRQRDRVLDLLGVLEPGQGLDEVYLDLAPDQIIGLYLPDEDRIYVVRPDSPGQAQREQALITLAHEYVHALQQTHFDLDSLGKAVPLLDFDRQLALSALVEGDASVFGFTAVAEQIDLRALRALQQAPPSPQGRAGQFVLQLLTYPYLAGPEFVLGTLLGSGLDGLNELYDPESVPRATAQITALGPRTEWRPSDAAYFTAPELPCWDTRATGTLGQFVLGVLLGGQIEQGERGPAGWIDDHLILLGNGVADTVIYRAEFEDDESAAGFFGGLRDLIIRGRLDHADRTGSISESGPAGLTWRLDGRTALARLDGSGVTLVVGDHDLAAGAVARMLRGEDGGDLAESDYCPAQ